MRNKKNTSEFKILIKLAYLNKFSFCCEPGKIMSWLNNKPSVYYVLSTVLNALPV